MAEAAENLDTSAAEPNNEPTTQNDPPPNDQPIAGQGEPNEPEPKQPEAPAWPDDWRDKLAGDDEKLRKRLDRFSTPADIVKSWRNAEQKISTGEYKPTLPDDATEEQVQEWRKENGIPESPEGYMEHLQDLGDGYVLGDEDKPVVEGFAEYAHKANMKPEQVKETVRWYYDHMDKVEQERAEQDNQFKQQAEDALRSEWGNEYRQNVNMIRNWMNSENPELAGKLFGARANDGTVLGNDPELLKFLANTARQINPVSTVVPGQGANTLQAIDDEIAQIEKDMRDNRNEYFKDDRKQKRYQELLQAKDRMK